MRPLRVDPAINESSDAAVGQAPESVLLDAFGGYCAICERPVRERVFAWDAVTGETVTRIPPTGIGTLLLLCPTCHVAQAGSDVPVEDLALPTSQVPFTISAQRVFDYTDDGGVFEGGAASFAAGETIRRFRLNDWPDPDPRRIQRVRALGLARQEAERSASSESSLREPWLPELMTLTGYLSIWIAELYRRYDRPEPILELLARGRDVVPGFFHGTDWAALESEPEIR